MPGRDLIQNPGPTNIPDRVLEAFRRPPVDFDGPEFHAIVERVWNRLPGLFGGALVPYAIEENVLGSIEGLLMVSPTVRSLARGGRVRVVGAGAVDGVVAGVVLMWESAWRKRRRLGRLRWMVSRVSR